MKFLSFQVVISLTILAVASADVTQPPAVIVKQSQDISADGSYSFSYETDNGIYHSESGTPVVTNARSAPVVVTQGEYQYYAPNGAPIKVKYVADQNGFQPEGEHIPLISASIKRALEYIRTHPPQPEQSNLK
ncbi:larval cuticle protein LCP-17-like isoform X1 [Apis florea]|uniref:larval cuticle protein LCP-17-like isoform X1 n=1 Tax=Apis florea TaxID=7463 RepID=UPI0006297843|nr:larval cuticle protein LCP-17-like isoform X1 [Apis florea]